MVISFSSIKGGTGKTSICIHVANYCAAAGYRVLVIDFDIQNSLSFYYLDELSITDRKNLALALNTKDLIGNIVPSNCFGIDILASSFSLTNLRTIGANTLRRMLADPKPGYDFILIDCAPTYDNLVLNAISASDLILTPVRLSQFDYKGALFYRDQIAQDTDRIEAWRIIFNFYKAPRTSNSESLRMQYESLFRDAFDGVIVPIQIPETALLQRSIDTRERMSAAMSKATLFNAVQSLAALIGANRTVGRY
jgi:chromosome partitioning protein